MRPLSIRYSDFRGCATSEIKPNPSHGAFTPKRNTTKNKLATSETSSTSDRTLTTASFQRDIEPQVNTVPLMLHWEFAFGNKHPPRMASEASSAADAPGYTLRHRSLRRGPRGQSPTSRQARYRGGPDARAHPQGQGQSVLAVASFNTCDLLAHGP